MPSIPHLEIRQTPARVGAESSYARLKIEQPRLDIEMEQEHVKAEINTTAIKIDIDQSEAWKALGRLPATEFSKSIRDKTDQVVQDYIAKVVDQGNRFAAIHLKEDPIPQFAADNDINFSELYYEGRASVNNVKYNVKPAEVDIKWRGGEVFYQVQTHKPIIEYQPADLNLYLRQRNNINITVSDIDRRI